MTLVHAHQHQKPLNHFETANTKRLFNLPACAIAVNKFCFWVFAFY